jgi:hypothetical protein
MSNPCKEDELQELIEKQKTHYEETGEWVDLNDLIKDACYDLDIETSMDDDSDNK